MKVKPDMCQNFYVRNHFKFPKRVRLASLASRRATTRKTDKTDAFGCTLPFRVIRYARNRRAVTRVRRRARAYTWAHRMRSPRCTSRVTIIGTPRHTDTPRPQRRASLRRVVLRNRDWKLHDFDTFDFRYYKYDIKNISPADCRASIVPNNYGDHFRVAALSKSNISKLCRF